jgi:K+/H+ antiporter YhaU regulatory subunit KhtT
MYSFLREAGTAPSRTQMQLTRLTEHVEFDDLSVKEGCPAAGKTLAQLQIRERTGAHVVAVLRAGQAHYAPEPSFALEAGDRVVLVGDGDALERAAKYFAVPTPVISA